MVDWAFDGTLTFSTLTHVCPSESRVTCTGESRVASDGGDAADDLLSAASTAMAQPANARLSKHALTMDRRSTLASVQSCRIERVPSNPVLPVAHPSTGFAGVGKIR